MNLRKSEVLKITALLKPEGPRILKKGDAHTKLLIEAMGYSRWAGGGRLAAYRRAIVIRIGFVILVDAYGDTDRLRVFLKKCLT